VDDSADDRRAVSRLVTWRSSPWREKVVWPSPSTRNSSPSIVLQSVMCSRRSIVGNCMLTKERTAAPFSGSGALSSYASASASSSRSFCCCRGLRCSSGELIAFLLPQIPEITILCGCPVGPFVALLTMGSDERIPGPLHGPMAEAAGRLRLTFDRITRSHRGELGARREVPVREFFERFLQDRLAVTHGQIITTTGEESPQLDVIIYDALETPMLDASESGSLVPIEGVYAVVEVASNLTTAKLRQDAEKITAVKRLRKNPDAYFGGGLHGLLDMNFTIYGKDWREFPIHGYSFGYESAPLDSLLDALRELDGQTPELEHRVDGVCSLSRGLIANGTPARADGGEEIYTQWNGSITPETERFTSEIDADESPGVSLMVFFLLMTRVVVQANTRPFSLLPYFER
jgi:hypothetical protein